MMRILFIACLIMLICKLVGLSISWWVVFSPLIAIAVFWTCVFILIVGLGRHFSRSNAKRFGTTKKAKF